MAVTGHLGAVPFEASLDTFRAPVDLKRTLAHRYHQHDILGRPARLQSLGMASTVITMAINLDARFCDPEVELKRLEDMTREGQAHPLVIGERVLGEFVLEEMAESLRRQDGRGRALSAVVNLKLKEYD